MCVWPRLKLCCVSTANNLLAQLWLLPRFSALLPSTRTDPHCHLLCPSGTRAGALKGFRMSQQGLWAEAGPFQCCLTRVIPSFHQSRQILCFSAAGPVPQRGVNFIFHLVATALILGLNPCKFRQALEKILFLLPLISPATPLPILQMRVFLCNEYPDPFVSLPASLEADKKHSFDPLPESSSFGKMGSIPWNPGVPGAWLFKAGNCNHQAPDLDWAESGVDTRLQGSEGVMWRSGCG